MHDIEKNCLVDFFESINENFEYVVMRNADELPYENFSNDIDILIDKKHYKQFEKHMNSIMLKYGFSRVERATTSYLECFTFYNISENIPLSLKIDLFFNLETSGLVFYTFEELIKSKILNQNNIYVFDKKSESFLTILKVLTVTTKVKEKYIEKLLENTYSYDDTLIKSCPSKTMIKNIFKILETKKNITENYRKIVLREVLINNFKKNYLSTLKSILKHYSNEINRTFKKQYMFVLVGPDGSGKTTMIETLTNDSKKYLRSSKERFSYFHHRPNLFRNISDLFKKEITKEELEERITNPHNGKQSNQIISTIKLLYYVLDYQLGYLLKLLPLQHKNQFIIFDRYFYDFIVDQKRSAIKINKTFVKLVYKLLIPKPNKIFFIRVDAELAYKRKGELSIEIIENINNQYIELSEEFNNFSEIKNEDFTISYRNFINEFILSITKDVK